MVSLLVGGYRLDLTQAGVGLDCATVLSLREIKSILTVIKGTPIAPPYELLKTIPTPFTSVLCA
jgi:hypothetical protein